MPTRSTRGNLNHWKSAPASRRAKSNHALTHKRTLDRRTLGGICSLLLIFRRFVACNTTRHRLAAVVLHAGQERERDGVSEGSYIGSIDVNGGRCNLETHV